MQITKEKIEFWKEIKQQQLRICFESSGSLLRTRRFCVLKRFYMYLVPYNSAFLLSKAKENIQPHNNFF